VFNSVFYLPKNENERGLADERKRKVYSFSNKSGTGANDFTKCWCTQRRGEKV